MQLSETWYLEGNIDFEFQQYRLLAYLQEVGKLFHETKLYPQLSDVIFHYKNLLVFQEHKQILQDQFPKQLDVSKLQQLEVKYAEMLADDELMRELERIAAFATERLKATLDEGVAIYEYVEQLIDIEPVGILPLYRDEGYLMLRYQHQTDVRVYTYATTLFNEKEARYRSVRTTFLDTWQASLATTYEQIKLEIIRQVKMLPNPAVFCAESQLQVPLQETFLPIAKRLLVRNLLS